MTTKKTAKEVKEVKAEPEKKEKKKKFILSDKAYDVLKWAGLIMVPLGTLISTLASVWHDVGEMNAIGATLSAFGVFIGSMIALSQHNYKDANRNGIPDEDE